VNGILEPLQDLTDFIENGWVDINALDDYGCSALYYACAYGQISIVDFLLCNGSHPQRGLVDVHFTRHVSSVDRHIPLCAAIRTGHVPIVERLLTSYVEAKILDSSPEALDYPLRLAVRFKQATITKLLIAHGATTLSSGEDTPSAVAGAIRE
jgi:ankyrin repeat protein